MKIVLDEEVLQLMIDRLSNDDILILEFLSKKKSINANMGLTKQTIIDNIEGLTDFKFQISSNRLFLALLIDKSTTIKPVKYFITKAGSDILKKYKQEVLASMKEI
jgi:hypothetical protein